MVNNWLLVICILLSVSAKAQTESSQEEVSIEDAAAEAQKNVEPPTKVEFFVPEDVSQESVAPKMDSPQAVMSRTLRFTNRFEIQASQAWILDEPFLNNSYQILELAYHWNETYGVGLKGMFFNAGTSDYSKQFVSSHGTQFDKVPNPKTGFGVIAHNRLFYGKLSFSEFNVFPTLIELVGDLGVTSQGSKSSLPYVSLGVGQKTYFGKFALGLHYQWLVHQTLDANSVNLQAGQTVDPSSFAVKTEFSHGLQLNFGYLF